MTRSRGHGRRKHLATCDCPAKAACYTTLDAAQGAVVRTPDAERAYRGTCCGHWHITRYTQDEYAQRVATYGVQDEAPYGTVVLPTHHEEDFDEQQETADAGVQPRGDEGGPRAETLERRPTHPFAEGSPADVARRIRSRRSE